MVEQRYSASIRATNRPATIMCYLLHSVAFYPTQYAARCRCHLSPRCLEKEGGGNTRSRSIRRCLSVSFSSVVNFKSHHDIDTLQEQALYMWCTHRTEKKGCCSHHFFPQFFKAMTRPTDPGLSSGRNTLEFCGREKNPKSLLFAYTLKATAVNSNNSEKA